MAGAYVAAMVLASSSSFSSSTTTATSTYTYKGPSDDDIWAVAILIVGIIYSVGGFMTYLRYSDSKLKRTAKEDERETFPRTKLVWEIIKMLLWPLGLLWWIIIGMIVEEWCKPAWKWFRRANKKEEWWCTCAGVDAWTCDVCCFRNCRDACDVFSGDGRVVIAASTPTGKVRRPRTKASWTISLQQQGPWSCLLTIRLQTPLSRRGVKVDGFGNEKRKLVPIA